MHVRVSLFSSQLLTILQNNVLLTGGEDSKLNVWTGPSLDYYPSSQVETGPVKRNSDDSMDIDEDETDRKRQRKCL